MDECRMQFPHRESYHISRGTTFSEHCPIPLWRFLEATLSDKSGFKKNPLIP